MSRNNSTRPKKEKTKQTTKKCLTSQTSGSYSCTESCGSPLTVCSDGFGKITYLLLLG